MDRRWLLNLLGALAVSSCVSCSARDSSTELLNVSYDPTRELWCELNSAFISHYEHDTGVALAIHQSHGGSGNQARAVVDGLEADVVTLALWSDTNLLQKAGLIAKGWEGRLPERSLPYYSTIVFVVRRGNPKGIKDWDDLVRSEIQVITPNPKTSGNGKLAFLAAWGSVMLAQRSEIQRSETQRSETAAREYVTRLYQQTPVLETGARAATLTFAKKAIGDVHLTWENEGHLEVGESHGDLELIYPSISIRAEPYVAVVDANVDHKGTRQAAEAYLKFLYTDEGQEIIGRHYLRPINPTIGKKYSDKLKEIKLFEITDVAKGWDDANKRFFAAGAVFDQIYERDNAK